jgi:hypothetical protein
MLHICMRVQVWVPRRMGVCACSLAYPACNAYVHIVMSFVAPQALSHFSTLSLNGAIFRKKLLNIKCVIFSNKFCLKHFSF